MTLKPIRQHAVIQTILFVLCLLTVTFTGGLRAADSTIQDQVNWPEFLAQSDLVWGQLPTQWMEGAFLGNGLLGATIYSDSTDAGLRWEIGRSDVADHRSSGDVVFAKERLPIGHFILVPAGKITGGTIRLDLWNAEAHGTLTTDRGTIQWRSFVSATDMSIVVECTASPDEQDFQWKWVAEQSGSTRALKGGKAPPGGYQSNPPSQEAEDGPVHTCVQPLTCGGEYATAWQESRPTPDKRIIVISVGNSWRVINGAVTNGTATDTQSGKAEAVGAVQQAASEGVDKLTATHQAWWHAYYPESFLSIPDTRLQSFYWIQMYKLGSGTRADRPAIDLIGPWFTTTLWPAYWCDLNLELTYYPVCTANRLELGESLVHMLDANSANLAHNAGGDGASIGGVTSFDCVSPGGLTSTVGNLTWLCQDWWKQCSYGADDAMLRDHLLPLLKRCINSYLGMLQKGIDGKLHLSITFSPEYGRAADCNYNLALLRWGCQTLIDEDERLNISDPLQTKWKDVLANLVDYPTGPDGYMIGSDKPLAKSHRHYSHLVMIYPLYLVNWDQPENHDLIEKSVDFWAKDESLWAGYSYAGAASMYASMGRGDNAVELLNHLLDNRLWESAYISPNTMYIEGNNPVMETPLAAAQSIQDMLLQSWGDTIRVFPGVPDSWKDVTIRDLRAQGAFLVSAARHEGKTQWVCVKSLAGRPCRVRPALEGTVKATVPLKPTGDGCYELQLAKGEEAVLYTGDQAPTAVVTAAPSDAAACNYFGSKAIAAGLGKKFK